MEASYTFEAGIRWTGERKGDLSIEGKPSIHISPPPEFGGPPGVISPEDLFVSSIVSAYMTTYLAMADKVRASFVNFSCQAEATLEKVDGKGLLFTKIRLKPKVRVADVGEEQPVIKALELAKKYCLVTNSITCRVDIDPRVDII